MPSWVRSAVQFVAGWLAYSTPRGEAYLNHLIETNLRRVASAITVEGVLLLLFGPLLGPRLMYLGLAYLALAGVARVVRWRYGVKASYWATYVASLGVLLPAIAATGGIYSYLVMVTVLLTILSSFAFTIRRTLLTVLALVALLGAMAWMQERGMWMETSFHPAPRIMWLLTTLTTINIAIPIVTTIQAFQEAMGLLEHQVAALGTAEEDARRLLDSQRRIFWDISHELRSPLTRLNLSVGKVRRELGARNEPALDRMETETERLNKLIHGLLLLAQLKHDVEFPMDQEFDLAAEVASVCEDAQFEANVAGRDLRLQSCGACAMRGCAELLRGAVDNVVRNAIRYTPEGSEIEVILSRPLPGLSQIVVADRGPGVPESQLPFLFEAFYRVPGESRAQGSGMGLGLAIAAEAVRKHTGQISASNRTGGGLKVTLDIPDGNV